MKNSLRADIGIIIVTLFWGIGFPVVKFAFESIGTLYQIGFRFIIAGIVLSLIFYKKLFAFNKKILKPAIILSLSLYTTYLFSIFGIQYTTSSNASFLCCLAVIFVPIIGYIYNKTVIKLNSALGIVICVIGLFIMNYSGEGLVFNVGDILCIMASVSFAFQIILTEKYVADCDPTLLSILQMFFVGIMGLAAAIPFEAFPYNPTPKSVYSLLFMGIFCSALSFWVQATCQKFTSSSHVAIIFTMEPVFGALASFLMLGENIGLKGIIGGMLIIAAMIISEINIPYLDRLSKKLKA